MISKEEAYEICEDIKECDEANGYAKAYAEKVIENQMTGEELDLQMNYIALNAPHPFKKRIAEWQGELSGQGFEFGHCQLCPDQDGENAYHGQDVAASGLVCVGCYEAFGSPNECADCGVTTYEGDTVIRGEREGDFLCNSCL